MLRRKGQWRGYEKGNKKCILAFAQRDGGRRGMDESTAAPLKRPAVKSVTASLRIMGACNPSHFLPPQYGANAGKQLSETEWFYDVVVRTELETDDAIDFVATMARRDDHRDVRMRTHFPQKIQPIILTEPQIQNDQ